MTLQLLFERLAPDDTSLGSRSRIAQALASALPGSVVAEAKPAKAGDCVLVFEDEALIVRPREWSMPQCDREDAGGRRGAKSDNWCVDLLAEQRGRFAMRRSTHSRMAPSRA